MEHPFVIDLAETVLALGRREATGALRVAVGHQIRLAFFENGDLVYFVSDVPEEALGPAFAREGRLATTESQAALALLERQVSRKRSLVTLVLETALSSPERLRSWLVEHAFECFGHAFDSAEGTARFAEGIRADHPLPFRVPSTTLILEGVRRMRNDALVRSAVGPLDYAVDPAPDHVERIQPLSLSFYDGLVASQITQPYVLADLMDVLGLPEPDVLRALLALRCVGVLNPFVPHQILSDSGRLKTDTGRLRTDSGKLILDSGRLRMLLEPDEPADEAVATAVAMALDMVSEPIPEPASQSVAAGGGYELVPEPEAEPVSQPVAAVSYEKAVPAPQPIPVPMRKSPSAPLPNSSRRRRGNTAQLNLLASAYRQMADKELESGNVAAAVRYYEAALAQCPENVDLVIGLADLLAHRPGGEELGEKLLRKACEEHKTAAAPRIALAKLLRSMGRASQAQQLIEEARLLDPENIELRALPAERQGGFFARLLGGTQDKGSANTAMPKSGRAVLSSTRCRYCGAMCRAGAVACVRCGATL